MSLTLLRPTKSKFRWKLKTTDQVESERRAYEAAARQGSYFDQELRALTPCPYAFHFDWMDADGVAHKKRIYEEHEQHFHAELLKQLRGELLWQPR